MPTSPKTLYSLIYDVFRVIRDTILFKFMSFLFFKILFDITIFFALNALYLCYYTIELFSFLKIFELAEIISTLLTYGKHQSFLDNY